MLFRQARAAACTLFVTWSFCMIPRRWGALPYVQILLACRRYPYLSSPLPGARVPPPLEGSGIQASVMPGVHHSQTCRHASRGSDLCRQDEVAGGDAFQLFRRGYPKKMENSSVLSMRPVAPARRAQRTASSSLPRRRHAIFESGKVLLHVS